MYSNLKIKTQNYITEMAYTDILEQIISGMLVFVDFPETVNTEFIPIYKMREGLCAIVDDVEQGAVGHCSLGGLPDLNGIGRDAIVSFDCGIVKEYKEWRTNEHIVVMFNDVLMRPDLNVGRYADMLTKLDISFNLNVLWSRLFPIPVAKTEDGKKALDDIIAGILKGDSLRAMLSSDILSEIMGLSGSVELVNLSDVNNADKIQYLSKAHDDIMRRFLQLYGMDVDGNGKLAQQTVAEIGSRQGASMIIPYNIMREAQRAVDECRRKFGWNCSVTFGRPWQYDLNNNGVLDVIEDEEGEQPAEDAPAQEQPEEVSENE